MWCMSCRRTAALQTDLYDSTQKLAKVQSEKEAQSLTHQRDMTSSQSKHEQEMKEKEQEIDYMVSIGV